jgi:cobaltochelatase CobT
MTQAQTASRQQQQVEELCAAAIRALSGQGDLHFRGRRLHRGRQRLPLFAPHLHPSLEHDDFVSFRGAADGLALRLRHSNAALHRSLCPSEPAQRLVFDLLEQIRVEACATHDMPGVRHNLRHRHDAWSREFHRSRLTDTASGILLYTVVQICRARVGGEPVLEDTEDLMEATRAALSPLIGHDLAALRRHRDDQAAYARHALSIARLLAEMLRGAQDGEAAPDGAADADDSERAAFSLLMDLDAQLEDGVAASTLGAARQVDGDSEDYKVFTTAYDRELPAASLVRHELLLECRAQLDRRIASLGVNVPRLARELNALLAQPQRDGWDSAREEGLIDGRRLSQLVASPTERRLFRVEREEPLADCVLSFLIDCSGSMKQHIEAVALLVDVFVRALEQAGVASEVLGFTTGAWNGGRARRDWLRAGRPPNPGRLNERCHMVFKEADTPWRRARPDIAALLRAELFREGIDGEAVDWACGRLNARAEARRILVVISDGCPMDGATHLANDAQILDRHLRQVVMRHELAGPPQQRIPQCAARRLPSGRAGRVGIFALGVGLDLSPYYSASQALELSSLQGNSAFRDILALLRGGARR